LRYPAWQALNILPEGMAVSYFEDCLEFMEDNKYNLQKGSYGFSDFQINKMKRLIDVTKLSSKELQKNPEELKKNRINFYRFFKEHDLRRGTDIVKTFPELAGFWKQCQQLNQEHQKALKKEGVT